MSLILALSALAMLVNHVIVVVNLVLGYGKARGASSGTFIVTKLLLVPLVGLVWYQMTTDFSWKVVNFMICAWIGDALLLFDETKSALNWAMNVLGAVFFSIAHMFLLWYFDVKWLNVPIWALGLLVPAALLFYWIVPKVQCSNLSEVYCVFYCCLLQVNYAAAIARISVYPVWHSSFLMVAIGYFFFLVSDSFLIESVFGFTKEPRRVHIMGTYAIAQTLIILGLGRALAVQ